MVRLPETALCSHSSSSSFFAAPLTLDNFAEAVCSLNVGSHPPSIPPTQSLSLENGERRNNITFFHFDTQELFRKSSMFLFWYPFSFYSSSSPTQCSWFVNNVVSSSSFGASLVSLYQTYQEAEESRQRLAVWVTKFNKDESVEGASG